MAFFNGHWHFWTFFQSAAVAQANVIGFHASASVELLSLLLVVVALKKKRFPYVTLK